MKRKFIVLILSILLGSSSLVFGYNRFQVDIKSEMNLDTLYYLADTVKIPKKDRIFVVENSYMEKNFFIYCSCLNTEQGYIYLSGAEPLSFIISKKKFKSLKLTSLAHLIAITAANNTIDFGKKYKIYIVLPYDKEKYTLYPVRNRSNNLIERMQ